MKIDIFSFSIQIVSQTVRIRLSYIDNTMAADILATHGAMASAAMVLPKSTQNIMGYAEERLNLNSKTRLKD